ncbi:hypothetical protein ACIBCS_23905 [Streptomyces phaeochromogenes]|uniref:hypothetical protein n=1 Tax=Streptomyces phaeochromogenes TaxID=1923 RepID=UPI0033DB4EA1
MAEYTKIEDLSVIRDMGTGLDNIRKAFEGLSKLKGKYEGDFGEHDLAWQFKDFVENWEIHREELAEEVKRLAAIAKAAAKAYEDIDHDLAEAIRGDGAKKDPGKGK